MNFQPVLGDGNEVAVFAAVSVDDAIMAKMIKTYSNAGDKVLDMTCCDKHLGSLCNKLGRNYVGVDVSDKYF